MLNAAPTNDATCEFPTAWRAHAAVLEADHHREAHARTDRAFAVLMVLQLVGVLVVAAWITPRTWLGTAHYPHLNMLAALVIGGLAAAMPVYLALRRPGFAVTRHVIAVGQMVFSALLIHLTGGRIESHFHVFGSLAFLAVYRDWKVLVTATLVTVTDHLLRATYWPHSIFGVVNAAPWRAMEHAGWVLFEDAFLVLGCLRGAKDVRQMAEREARLSHVNASTEYVVAERTAELEERRDDLLQQMEERKRLESQLVQAQKLESIGQLAAGIAHEINTPAQYVGDNTRFLRDQFGDITALIQAYQDQLDPTAEPEAWEARAARMNEQRDAIDYPFLEAEVPEAIAQTLEGIERITEIVLAMKSFSHPGAETKEAADLNLGIRSTVTVCRNRWKYAADLTLDLDPDLPPVPCLLSELNQVILNLIVNAADAIGERLGDTGEKGLIQIVSRLDGDHAEVRITDNGGGIPDAIADRIFDPFFTTKDVGQGTGQGLAISRDVINHKHGGTLTFAATAGEGTTFVLRLPLEDRLFEAAEGVVSDPSTYPDSGSATPTQEVPRLDAA